MTATDFSKIRILWIQDTTDIPGRDLPDHLQRYFDVMTKSSDNRIWPVVSMEAFKRPLECFWFEQNTDILPVEIMAVDYDLSKASATWLAHQNELRQKGLLLESEPTAMIHDAESVPENELRDFDGLLLGIFYSTLVHRHPVGFVPTTYRLNEMAASVPSFHRLSERILGINFSWAGTHRSWENIVEAGAQSLRQRMKTLCKQHYCVFDMNDLQALIKDPSHETLGFYSPYAIRRIPVRGLFIDKHDEEERRICIREWSISMIEQLSSYQELQEAEQFAEDLWHFYDNDELVNKREELSRLLSEGDAKSIPRDLQKIFAPIIDTKKPRCQKGCFDIRTGSYRDSVRRLTVLVIILRLLKRCILARKAVQQMVPPEARANSTMLAPDRPILNNEDVYLALFPVPDSPLVLPWHAIKRIDASHGWASSLMDWSAGEGSHRRKGDLALKIQDVLDGKDWNPDDGCYGLMPGERHILRCKAFSDSELSANDWKSYTISMNILRLDEAGA